MKLCNHENDGIENVIGIKHGWYAMIKIIFKN